MMARPCLDPKTGEPLITLADFARMPTPDGLGRLIVEDSDGTKFAAFCSPDSIDARGRGMALKIVGRIVEQYPES